MSVPALRFKSFDDEWKVTLVLNFAPLQRGFDLPVSTIVNGKFPVVFSNGILKHHNEYKAIAPGVVTGRSGTIGNVTYVEENYWPHNTSLWVTDFKNNIPKFVYYFYIQFDLSKLGTGSGVPTLNRNDVHSKNILIPSLPEQTKIANFLTAVDEKISLLTQKATLLSQYKKGVMQQIFSQELRFKDDDGQEFPEWEDGHLGDVFEYRNGKSFENEVIKNGEYFLITLNSIDIDGRLKPEHKRVAKTDSSLLKNDLIMVLSDVAHGNFLGLTDIIPSDRYVLNQRIGGLRAKKDINVRFASLYINFNQKYFKLHGQGSSQLNLSKGDVIDFILPRLHIKEQTKIANFLTAVDDKITNNQNQLDAIKQYKQGLLQLMFV
jgi:restriction endonuclease S subunit